MKDKRIQSEGVLDVRLVMTWLLEGREIVIRETPQPVVFLPESITALDTLEQMRENSADMAVIIDEFSVLGVVTRSDLLEVMVGQPLTPQPNQEFEVTQRADGSLLVGRIVPGRRPQDSPGFRELPREAEVRYETLAGMVLSMLERLPVVGDSFDWNGFVFEVVDMDGMRVDKVLISRVTETDSRPELA